MAAASRLTVADVEEIGLDYAETLRRWRANFHARLERGARARLRRRTSCARGTSTSPAARPASAPAPSATPSSSSSDEPLSAGGPADAAADELRAYKIRHLDAERIPATGPVVLAANHESVLDPWFLGTVTPRPVHYLTKAELFRYPRAEADPRGPRLHPRPPRADMGRAVDAGVEALDRGELIGIFPQGTCLPHRNRRSSAGPRGSRSRPAPRSSPCSSSARSTRSSRARTGSASRR